MQQLSSTIRMVSKSIKFNWNLIFLLSQTAGSAVLPKQLELLHLILPLYKVLSFEMGLFKSLVNCTSCPHELSPMRKHTSSRLQVLRLQTSHRNDILGHLNFYLISPGIVEIHQKIVSRIFCKKSHINILMMEITRIASSTSLEGSPTSPASWLVCHITKLSSCYNGKSTT